MKAEALALRSQAESEAKEIERKEAQGETIPEELLRKVEIQKAQAKSQLDRSKKWLNNKPVQEMLKFFKNLPGIRIETGRDTFDQHPHLLNVPNGTIDLKTGMLRAHDPSEYLTTLCPIEFDPRR